MHAAGLREIRMLGGGNWGVDGAAIFCCCPLGQVESTAEQQWHCRELAGRRGADGGGRGPTSW